MRALELEAHISDVPADVVYGRIARFDRFPELAPHVQSTTVHQTLPEPIGSSSWELEFRSGLLRWTESDRFTPDEFRIDFEQTDGDFDEFVGYWQLTPQGSDTQLTFRVDFDFGIPSLEGILDPIAERVIKETVAWAVIGMHDNVKFAENFTIQPAQVAAAHIQE